MDPTSSATSTSHSPITPQVQGTRRNIKSDYIRLKFPEIYGIGEFKIFVPRPVKIPKPNS
jgi:hypothetical protein